MKTLLIAIVFAAIFSFGRYAYSVDQPHSLGAVSLGITNQTVSQIRTSSPTIKGELRFCTNCTANGALGTICVSTSVLTSDAFVLSTGTVCK